MYILGIDVGGTKCAAVTGDWDGENIKVLKRESIPTDHNLSGEEMLFRIFALADSILERTPDSVGISCGGPLDSCRGIVINPPNLPRWNNVEAVRLAEEHFGARAHLQNDANASAVAEWKFGAGKGANNLVFLTFGTGLGAGLILDGRLYKGTNGNAGEVGHVRLSPKGPVGFGKHGSFEGFCSGGGIAQLGYTMALEEIKKGTYPAYFQKGMKKEDISAKSIADAAQNGDKTAIKVYKKSGKYLGRGLSIIIDMLNPERIVIGGVFMRSQALLWEGAKREIEREAIMPSQNCCQVLPSVLGEAIGDYAALATALL